MTRSFSLVDTGSPFTLQVQAASQRAGHTRQVNSGKLWVLDSLRYACLKFPRYTRSLVSGTRLCRGQPEAIPPIMQPDWQKGTPHSMQRAACFLCSSSFSGVLNSWKCLILSRGASAVEVSRSYSKNPVGFPIFLLPPAYFT